MGQRHQAFMIARVIPHRQTEARYRCVGALHHQWCYGTRPLEAAHRVMALIRQPDNAEVILEELRSLDGVYGHWRQRPKIKDVPCPYTQFLFKSAWTDCSDQRADMGANEGDNNDGITVIDITDPENPSYCFVTSTDLSRLIPVSAETYVREYYPVPEEEDDEEHIVRGAITNLAAFPVIDRHVLVEAWPRDRAYYTDEDDADDGELGNLAALEPHRKRTRLRDADTLELRKSSGVPSLVDMVLKPTVEKALADNNIDGLDTMILDPAKASIIETVVRSTNPITEAGFHLLRKILLAHKKPEIGTLDLSGFHLSGEHIVALVREYVVVHNLVVDVLKLSDNDQLNINGLREILTAFPILRRLVLFNTPITDTEVIALVRDEPALFRHMEGLIHPAFMKEGQEFYPAFTYQCLLIDDRSCMVSSSFKVAIPFFTPNMIVQALTYHMRQLNGDDYWPYREVQAAFAAFATGARTPDKAWTERTVPFIPSSKRGGGLAQWTFIVREDKDDPANYTFGNTPTLRRTSYAFIRFNTESYIQQFKKDSSPPPSKRDDGLQEIDPMTIKANDARQFEHYDIRAFFKELEAEGRPSPDHEALVQLYDIFDTTAELITYDEVVKDLDALTSGARG